MADKELEKYEKRRQKERDKFEAERKKWKQQETKKRVKKSSKRELSPVWFKAAAIVVSAAIVLGIGSIYAVSYGIPGRFYPALTVEGMTVYEPEWAFYFYGEYMRLANTAAQYAQYGLGSLFGLDISRSPFGQAIPESAFGTAIPEREKMDASIRNWDDYLCWYASNALQTGRALYAEALKAGFTVSEKDQKEIDEGMEQLREDARKYAVSVSAMLRMNYTPGITERFYRRQYERDMVTSAFQEQKQEELRGNYTEAMLQKEYDEDPGAYDLVDLRIQAFSKKILEPKEGESEEALAARQAADDAEKKKEAEEFLAAAGTEEAFIAAAAALLHAEHADEEAGEEEEEAEEAHDHTDTADANTLEARLRKADLSTRYQSEDMADWAFDTARKAGDRDVIETGSSFFAVYVTRAPYAPVTVDFYTLSLPLDVDEYAGEEEIDYAIEEARESAEELLAEWKNMGATREAFASLVMSFAVAAGDPNAEEPDLGLSKAAKPGDAQDAAVDQWLFAAGRKTGDYEIIESEYGITIAYLVSKNEEDFVWKSEMADKHVAEDYEAYLEELRGQYPKQERKLGINAGLKAAQRMCDAFVLSYSQYSAGY